MDSVPRWTVETGGSITPNGSGFDIDGEVNPALYMNAEAYLISFSLTGSVTFDIGGATIAADGDAQTITAGANTVVCGQASGTPGMFVRIRVTPSHICVWAEGNYWNNWIRNQAGQVTNLYGILTVDRSGPVPATFTTTWASATVGGFEIADSTVSFDPGDPYGLANYCWVPPLLSCPYLFIKTITNDHQFQNAGGDWNFADVVITGDDPFLFDPPNELSGWIGDTFLGPGNQVGDDYPDPLEPEWRAYGAPSCSASAFACRWYQIQEVGSSPTYGAWTLNIFNNPFCQASYTIKLDWNTPTPAEPYPKPFFDLHLHIAFVLSIGCSYLPTSQDYTVNFTSGGSVDDVLPVNDLLTGFTLVVVPADTTADYSWMPAGTNCWDSDGSPTLTPSTLDQHAFAAVVGATWTFTP